MECRQIVLDAPESAAALLRPLGELEPDLVLVFGSVALLPALAQALAAAFPGARVAGCSTAGEISGQGVTERTCVVTAVKFGPGITLRVAEAAVPAMDACEGAGASLGGALKGPGLRAVLLFGKGTGVNGSAIIQGLAGEVGPHTPISGGLAGDDGAFQATLTLGPSGLSADGIVAVGLYGEGLTLSYGSQGGWTPFGPTRKVTRSQGNILFELDGAPALDIYKRYLGDHAQGLPASGLLFPFEMLDEQQSRLGLIRTILGVDEAEGSIVLAGDIVPGGFLRLMQASTNNLVDGAEGSARQVAEGMGAAPRQGLALLVSCVGRRIVMGDGVEEEIEAVGEVLGAGATLAGFYSYGEIAPFGAGAECKLHNQTMTITFLGER